MLALLAVSYRLEAAELEGFGPIRFGMTQEEASAALLGEGETLDGNWLRYTLKLGDDGPQVSVIQKFEDGRASLVLIDLRLGLSPAGCIALSEGLATMVESKHGVTPIRRTIRHGGSVDLALIMSSGRDAIEDFLFFPFDHGAHILMHFTSSATPGGGAFNGCLANIFYAPPQSSPLPF